MSVDASGYPEPPGWLAMIPGYRGYHAKEQRRQADHALREDLARRISQSAQALQRLSAALARERRFSELGPVDAATRRLQHLTDRLRSAPEGYRGLFEQEKVDEAALDQIILFDRSLAAGVERLSTLTTQLDERTPAPILDSPAGQELTETTERLLRRLDARTTVMTSGQPLTPEQALDVLAEPKAAVAPLTLKVGDAVSHGDANYITDAVIAYAGERAWTEYRLRDGSRERWLVVIGDEPALLEPVDAAGLAESDAGATLDGAAYTLAAKGQATANLAGPSGERRNVPVSFRDYHDDADGRLALRDWGDERRLLRGHTVDRELLTIYPRA